MKIITLFFLIGFISIQPAFSQIDKLENKHDVDFDFSAHRLKFIDSTYSGDSRETSYEQKLDILNHFKTLDFNNDILNKNMFSNLKLVENTYIDYGDYIRGCGPLEDGLYVNAKSSDVFISNVIDNLVNNYIIKGIFFNK